jgi:hypothetical protein
MEVSMSVVCRFRVTEIAQLGYGSRIKLSAMHTADGEAPQEVVDEIRSFYEATPNGTFEAVIKNEKAAEQFQVGQDYYLRLDRVPEPVEA